MDIEELKQRVKEVQQSRVGGVRTLDLSGVNLTHEQFKKLIPEIKQIPNLSLNLSNNEFEVFPKEICELNSLYELQIRNNKIKELPTEIEGLNNLAKLDLSYNLLESLPESLLNSTHFQENLQINLRNNPALAESFQRALDDNFAWEPLLDINAPINLEKPIEIPVALKRIYGKKAGKVAEAISKIKLDSVYVGDKDSTDPDNKIELTPPGQVMLELASKTPSEGIVASTIYLPALQKLIESAGSKRYPKEERQAVVEKVAVSLGNCATPVKSFLTQQAIGDRLETGKKLPDLFKSLLVAEGFEDVFRKEFKEELKNSVESSELLAGLSNLVFLKNTERYQNCPFKVKGDEVGLPSRSEYVDFGFGLIKGNQEIENKFVELCCKTDKNGKAIIAEDGSYTIAPEKYNAISEKKFAELGIISEREKKVNMFEKEMQHLLSEHDLVSHYDKEDVLPFLDVNKLKNELRIELQSVSDKDINAVVTKHRQANVKSIRDLGKKYQEKEMDMSLMMRSSAKPIVGNYKKQEANTNAKNRVKRTSPSL